MESPIITNGIILEKIKAELYRVALPNGKVVHGHLSTELRRKGELLPPFSPQSVVRLEMTPYDFDKARITGKASVET